MARPPAFTVRGQIVAVPFEEQRTVQRIAAVMESTGWNVESFSVSSFKGVSFIPPGRKVNMKFILSRDDGLGTPEGAKRALHNAAARVAVGPGNFIDWVVTIARQSKEAVTTTEEAISKAASGELPFDPGDLEDVCKKQVGVKCSTLLIGAGAVTGLVLATTLTGNVARLLGR